MGLPIREARIGALSSACGRRARFANAQALLAIFVTLNPAQRARDSNPLRLPSSLRGGFKRLIRNQVSLRSLILALGRFALVDTGVTMGLPPQALPEGVTPSGRFGRQPKVTPVLNREAIPKKQESGSEAKPDSG